jgi:hypothetical protein
MFYSFYLFIVSRYIGVNESDIKLYLTMTTLQVAGSCLHANETFCSTKRRESFLVDERLS